MGPAGGCCESGSLATDTDFRTRFFEFSVKWKGQGRGHPAISALAKILDAGDWILHFDSMARCHTGQRGAGEVTACGRSQRLNQASISARISGVYSWPTSG